jgi:hypothetical protein
MSFYHWRPYVTVQQRQAQARREVAKLEKKGRKTAPVTIAGRAITTSFWGKAWCSNLERYSDFANRLPRGRTYVRNGSVVDLQISSGEVTALVAGSSLYEITIKVTPVKTQQWKSICRDCAGSIDSLVELLQGRLAKGVMDRVCRAGDGLFPSPAEITLDCSCPDWADMCKHVAAVLYGVGARLDHSPKLLFLLRDVDETELIAGAGEGAPLAATPVSGKVLGGDVAALFGLEMADDDAPAPGSAGPAPPADRAANGGGGPVARSRGGPSTKSASPPKRKRVGAAKPAASDPAAMKAGGVRSRGPHIGMPTAPPPASSITAMKGATSKPASSKAAAPKPAVPKPASSKAAAPKPVASKPVSPKKPALESFASEGTPPLPVAAKAPSSTPKRRKSIQVGEGVIRP